MERPGLAGKWKKLKKDQIFIGILVGVLLLVIALPMESGSQKGTEDLQPVVSTAEEPDSQTEQMEKKLQRILEQVEGVGKVQVMITAKSSGRKTVEKDSSVSEDSSTAEAGDGSTSRRTEETTVFERDSQGNEIPFVIEETAPEIEGVLVAAQGGDNLTVAENIIDAAEVLFGVEAHKIKVMKLN